MPAAGEYPPDGRRRRCRTRDAALDIRASDLTLAGRCGRHVGQSAADADHDSHGHCDHGRLVLPGAGRPDGDRAPSALAAGGDMGIVSLTGNLLLQSLQAQGLVTLVAEYGGDPGRRCRHERDGDQPGAARGDRHRHGGAAAGHAGAALEASRRHGRRVRHKPGQPASGRDQPVAPGPDGPVGHRQRHCPLGRRHADDGREHHDDGAGGIDLSATSDLVVQAAIASEAGPIELTAQRALRVEGTSITSDSGPITLVGQSQRSSRRRAASAGSRSAGRRGLGQRQHHPARPRGRRRRARPAAAGQQRRPDGQRRRAARGRRNGGPAPTSPGTR